MSRKKPDGLNALLKPEPTPIEDINLLDWFASFFVLAGYDALSAYDNAEDMLRERQRRMK
jgi:hypothetical protein